MFCVNCASFIKIKLIVQSAIICLLLVEIKGNLQKEAKCQLSVAPYYNKTSAQIYLNLTGNFMEHIAENLTEENIKHKGMGDLKIRTTEPFSEHCVENGGNLGNIKKFFKGVNESYVSVTGPAIPPLYQFSCAYHLWINFFDCESNFTIPDCLSDVCNCEIKGTTVTNVSLKRTEKEWEFIMSWQVKGPPLKNITKIEVEPKTKSGQKRQLARIRTLKNNSFSATEGTALVSLHEATLPGTYEFITDFLNVHNCEFRNYNTSIEVLAKSKATHYTLIIAIFVLSLLSVVLYYVLGPIYSQKCRNKIKSEQRIEQNVIYEALKDDLELDSSNFYSMVFRDKGSFGRVYSAKYHCPRSKKDVEVAIKILQVSERTAFFQEFDIMKEIHAKGSHLHIVSLTGHCTIDDNPALVMELVPCGSLQEYLENLRNKWNSTRTTMTSFSGDSLDCAYIEGPDECTVNTNEINEESHLRGAMNGVNNLIYLLDHCELEDFALQIAKGMAFLESIFITHRDLAARNILISRDRILKISDFGMSRSFVEGPYIIQETRKIPMRWMALEAIVDHQNTNKSDVWSYGVVLWEIGTLGALPYNDLQNEMVLGWLMEGNRLSRPEICTDELYSLMLQCWKENPENRPHFHQIVEIFQQKKNNIYMPFDKVNRTYIFPPVQ